MIVPQEFTPHISVSYPPSNHLIFEEWYAQQPLPEIEREYLGIFWTSYLVNNGYGEEPISLQKLQSFIDGLPRDKKYYTIFQFDNGCMVDFKDLDIVTFGMSYRLPEQKPTYVIPLIGQMLTVQSHFEVKNKWDRKCNFIGSKTHPIREKMLSVVNGKSAYYLSTTSCGQDEFYKIIESSRYTLCPRGYGIPSFRCYEAIHQGSVPVYISDDFMEPYGIDFDEYGVKIHESAIDLIDEILDSISIYSYIKKLNRMKELYPILCTYSGVFSEIIKTLQNE